MCLLASAIISPVGATRIPHPFGEGSPRRCCTYRSDVDGCCKVTASPYLCPVQAVEDLARVGGEGGEYLWARAAHAHEADR